MVQVWGLLGLLWAGLARIEYLTGRNWYGYALVSLGCFIVSITSYLESSPWKSSSF